MCYCYRSWKHPPLQPIPALRNKHVIVVQDFLTKWPFVFAVPDQKTHRIARLIVEEVVPMVGADRGQISCHTDVCELLGIEKLNTTAYHPQCSGLVQQNTEDNDQEACI